MELSELVEGLPVTIRLSSENLQPAVVVRVHVSEGNRDLLTREVEVEVQLSQYPHRRRRVPISMLRPYSVWEQWSPLQELDEDLRQELRAQVRALHFDRQRDGIKISAQGPYARVTVDAYGIAAARLLRLVRQHFVFGGSDHE